MNDAELRRGYERDVRALEIIAKRMRADGADWEMFARDLVQRRNRLKVEYRSLMKHGAVKILEKRNLNLYSDAVGPGADQQFARYGDWQAVAEAAFRPGRLRRGTSFAKFVLEQQKKSDASD